MVLGCHLCAWRSAAAVVTGDPADGLNDVVVLEMTRNNCKMDLTYLLLNYSGFCLELVRTPEVGHVSQYGTQLPQLTAGGPVMRLFWSFPAFDDGM